MGDGANGDTHILFPDTIHWVSEAYFNSFSMAFRPALSSFNIFRRLARISSANYIIILCNNTFCLWFFERLTGWAYDQRFKIDNHDERIKWKKNTLNEMSPVPPYLAQRDTNKVPTVQSEYLELWQEYKICETTKKKKWFESDIKADCYCFDINMKNCSYLI